MAYAAVIVGLGTAAYSIISGASKKSKAKKMARKNQRPNYEIPKAVQDNQRILESRASQGLSDQSIQLYKQSSDRQTTSSLDAILKGGGNVNNIAELYDTTNVGINRMALIDDEMRARNVQALVNQNNVLGGHQDKAWQVNYWGPYADKAQAAAALQKQGADQINQGITTAGNTLMGAATSGMFKSEGAGVFGKAAGAGSAPAGGTSNAPYGGASGGREAGNPWVNNAGADGNPWSFLPAGYGRQPEPVQSNLLTNNLTPAQQVQQKYPGLGSGRRGGMSSLDPVWSPELNSYVNPLTNEPF